MIREKIDKFAGINSRAKILPLLMATVLFIAPTLTLFAQQKPDDYNATWKTIDSLIDNKGLPQSAGILTDKLYVRAKKEHNDTQLIKALLYGMKLQQNREEDASLNNSRILEREIDSTQGSAKAILTSILAETYWNWFQQNRFRIYGRTSTTQADSDDPAGWTPAEFHKKIGDLYMLSLGNPGLLQQTDLSGYNAILVKGNTRNLRPTLFDLLAHRALDFFKNNETDINRPAYAFEIDDSAAFSEAPVFAAHSFTSADSASYHFQALLLFRQLIAFHLGDANPAAFLDVDIERITFAHNYAFLEEKDRLYLQALKQVTAVYPDHPIAAEAWYLQAQWLVEKGSQYDPNGDTAHRFDRRDAISICQRVLIQKDSSEGRSHCETLLKTLTNKELQLQTEKVNIPGQPFRALITWQNFSKVYFRLIPIDHAGKESLGTNIYSNLYWKKLVNLTPLKTFLQDLPVTGDYQQHRMEIKIEGLPVGGYALLASGSEDFSPNDPPLSVQFFYCSDIAYIYQGDDFFVLNRSTGQPITDASVQIWNPVYSSQTGTNTLVKSSVYHSDPTGHFQLREKAPVGKTSSERVDRLLEISTGTDHLFTDDAVNINLSSEDKDVSETQKNSNNVLNYENKHRQTFFFTDRSLYRPGQTVYFKGIVVTQDFTTRQSKIWKDLGVKLYLYNANDEITDSILVKTNEFGSYQGRFELPVGLLNGEFRLEDDSASGNASFSVEEYKRPKFHVEYEPLKGSHRLFDSVKIQGMAKAYAGNDIEGASVTWRVVREARFPYFSRWFMRFNRSQEIAHGLAKTGAGGRFTLSFQAIPDRSIDKALDPVFTYRIEANVTDINGETRTGETTIPVGYKAILLSVELPSDPISEGALCTDSLKKIALSTTNNAGIFESVPVHISVFRLKATERLIRSRYWEQPDQFSMTREEYIRYFPHDEYSNETQKATWERTEKVLELAENSRENGELPIGNKKFKAGWYAFDITAKDKYGQEVKETKYIELFEGNSYTPANPRYDWIEKGRATASPGSHIRVAVGSSAKDVYLIRSVEKESKTLLTGQLPYDFFPLSGNRKEFNIDVLESDRGGFGIRHVFVADNRLYTGLYTVTVPWSDKDLSIGYSSYRDKTLPGSAEKWQLTIRGNKGGKVTAEVLAGMYDASLDLYKSQQWSKPDLWYSYSPQDFWNSDNNFGQSQSMQKNFYDGNLRYYEKRYDALLQTGMAPVMIRLRGLASAPAPLANKMVSQKMGFSGRVGSYTTSGDISIHGEVMAKAGSKYKDLDLSGLAPSPPASPSPVQLRKNFNETAFFFPDLRTDSAGNVSFSFTMPEALTTWKWMTLAHTKDLAFGYAEKTIVTQKQLMVQPNAPRFLREGDRIELSAKIVNLTDSEMTGQVELQLIDATTNQSVDGWFINRQANQYFTVAAGQSAAIRFPVDIPYQFNRPVTYRIIARAGSFSDGEEDMLPVISNRVLVTESLPLNIRGTGTRSFRFEKLLQSGSSETLNHHALTVEFSSNPAWYAVQALPYLIEYPYECAEQTFERYYANALAASIVKGAPRIQKIFASWQTTDTAALLSNLEKNPELKSALLEETPWVLEAKSESQQKKNIALLFDMTRLTRELETALNKLQQMQSDDGGFVWFKGGPDDRYITQTILTGIGHLKKLGAIPAADAEKINAIVQAAMAYLDKKMIDDYERAKKRGVTDGRPAPKSRPGASSGRPGPPGTPPIESEVDNIQIQYLYLRSLFKDLDVPGPVFPAMNFYRKQTQQHWLEQNRYMQGMIALSLFRTGDIRTAQEILKSLKQNALTSEELGMYWKDMQGGYYWYQAPIETQSLLIEAFREITHDTAIDQGLKTWLLKQKQTQSWSTTKATADACYALLLGGSDWLAGDRKVEIHLGDQILVSDPTANDSHTSSDPGTETTKAGSTTVYGSSSSEAGTGYFKKVFPGTSVKPDMGNISVTIGPSGNHAAGNATSVAWGAVYWQYFENSDKITGAATMPLKLTKALFLTRNTDRGPVLEPVRDNAELKIGDKVTVRIELKADRDMQYVHLKDMRASCMEPTNVLSEYKWQDGLGYYETTKDASTNFFFDRIPRGSYVFEYTLFVSQAGNFSNGITSIQCMYAPEFTSHSEGSRVSIAGE